MLLDSIHCFTPGPIILRNTFSGTDERGTSLPFSPLSRRDILMEFYNPSGLSLTNYCWVFEQLLTRIWIFLSALNTCKNMSMLDFFLSHFSSWPLPGCSSVKSVHIKFDFSQWSRPPLAPTRPLAARRPWAHVFVLGWPRRADMDLGSTYDNVWVVDPLIASLISKYHKS